MANNNFDSLYGRQSAPANGGTVIPGMNPSAPAAAPQPARDVPQKVRTESVVGFLYSISRNGFGEFWPLYIGSNSIGRGENCNVRLREGTVSDLHATINIKKMKTGTGKVLAQIQDKGSKNGIFVNEEELDYDVHPCKDHDIIQIGDNYRLLLLLINAEEVGLTVANEFIELEGEDEAQAAPSMPFDGTRSPFENGFNGGAPAGGLYDGSNRPQNGTMSIDGFVDNSGKTQFL